MGKHADIPIKYHKIKNTFLLKRKIGKGSFGVIYSADNIHSNERVAVKFEKVSIKRKTQTLLKEAKILHLIHKAQVDGFPKIIYFNKDESYRMLIMGLLGRNLQRCLEKAENKLSLATVLNIGLQLIDRLQDLHELGYIHRDLKPENICTDLKKSSGKIYLIDFGLSKKYIEDDGKHILIREKRGLVGTIRYTSCNSHLSIEQSRRDDMESLGYILIYLAKAKLPWQGLIFFDEDMRMRRIAELKCSISSSKLCEGLPEEFELYMNHVKSLKFTETPDYDYMRRLFQAVATARQLNLEQHCFEWQTKKKSFVVSQSTEVEEQEAKMEALEKKFQPLKKSETSKSDHKVKLSTVGDLEIEGTKKIGNLKVQAQSSHMLRVPNRLASPQQEFGSNMYSNESKASEKIMFSAKVLKDSMSFCSKDDIFEKNNFFGDQDLQKVGMEMGSKKKILKAMDTLKEEPEENEVIEENSKSSESCKSEDFSYLIMNENTQNISNKLMNTTLTKSKLISDVMKSTNSMVNHHFKPNKSYQSTGIDARNSYNAKN